MTVAKAMGDAKPKVAIATAIASSKLLLAAVKAIAVVRGSRHGTPFDAVEATNACIFALLSDQPPPSADQLACDEPQPAHLLEFVGSLAAQHAMGP